MNMSSDSYAGSESVDFSSEAAVTSKPLASSEYDSEQYEAYRALSKLALVSFGFSCLGLFALLFPQLMVLPLVGLFSGLLALRKVRRYRNELTGKRLAVIGTLLSGALLVGGSSLHAYVYMNEVPDGYQRVNWYELRGQERQPVNPFAMQINNKPIFVKGYVHPGVDGFGEIKNFVLVPDMKTCCFGGQPKPWDMIEITLAEGSSSVKYSRRKRGLWGVFKIGPTAAKQIGKVQPGYYQMTADDLR